MLVSGHLKFDGAGRVRCTTARAPDQVSNGTPTTSDGLLAMQSAAPTGSLHGLPVTATQALAVAIGGAADHAGPNGLSIASDERLVVDDLGAVTGHVAGLPVTATGALAIATPEP